MGHETTERLILASESSTMEEACLVLIYGAPELGKRFTLSEDVFVGRESANGIVVNAGSVSRHHARLEMRSGAWFISDLGSTNGTRRNGEEVHGPERLANGDLVKIGGVIFKYIAGGNVESLFHEEIYRLTIFDGLTRLHNKRYFLEFLDREIARALRYGSSLSLVMIDVDHFKKINDTYGHPTGDRVLEKIASLLGRSVRREQLLARYGGEEFALVLPELADDQVVSLCESVRTTIEDEVFELDAVRLPVTISLGATTLAPPMARNDLIHQADAQLYRAKKSGRNQTCFARGTSSNSVTDPHFAPPSAIQSPRAEG